MDERHYSPLQRVLLGLESPGEPSDTQSPGWKAEGLNLSQQAAANFAIDSPYLALIHGPPGVRTRGLVNFGMLTTDGENGNIDTNHSAAG